MIDQKFNGHIVDTPTCGLPTHRLVSRRLDKARAGQLAV